MSLSGRTRLTVCLTRLQLRQALSRAQQALHELRRWRLDGPNATRAAATSLAILPFLARGHDHKTPGPYREHIARGIDVRSASLVFSVVLNDESTWTVTLDDGTTHIADGVIVTCPLPQSYSLLVTSVRRVAMRPPMPRPLSKTVTVHPWSDATRAAMRPASPAPTTITRR